jgi:branched-chain amino acid transport system ATP-binding protein
MGKLLTLHRITRNFAGLRAVDLVDLTVSSARVHALIGPNGAGKTTLFNLISGIIAPSAGTIRFDGADITNLSADRRAALGIARTFQNIRVFGAMTVLENVLTGLHTKLSAGALAVVLRTLRFRAEERAAVQQARAALALVGLDHQVSAAAGSLAYGDQRRLEIARAMVAEPRLLLLDEPAAGMNPAETDALKHLVQKIRHAGTTVLLVEHDMGFVMDISDDVTVLNFGRRIFDGSPTAARASSDVIAAYLGPKVAARLAGR